MTSSLVHRFGKVIALVVLLVQVPGCHLTSLGVPGMTPLSARLQSSFQALKPVCFGRFVMDVPVTSQVVWGTSYAPDEFDRLAGEGPRIDEHVKQRESELKAQIRMPNGSGATLHEKTLPGALPGQKIVVGWQTFSYPFYKVESYLRLGDDLFVQAAEATDKTSEMHVAAELTLAQVVERLNLQAKTLRLRPDNEVPTEPGICLDGAFSSHRLDSDERLFLGVRLAEFPDVHLSVKMTRIWRVIGEGQGLDARLAEAKRDADRRRMGGTYARFIFFRRGERDLNGLGGFEVLARRPPFGKGRDTHQFAFYYEGVPKEESKPLFDIRLDTGVRDNSAGAERPSLTDEEAVAVWDKLLGSIRFRPVTTTPTKTGAAPIAPSPLGTTVVSGQHCPQSGWWECVERTLPVQGGQRQHFEQGRPMPRATLLADTSFWQKLRGGTPTYRVDTAWKLVEYDNDRAGKH